VTGGEEESMGGSIELSTNWNQSGRLLAITVQGILTKLLGVVRDKGVSLCRNFLYGRENVSLWWNKKQWRESSCLAMDLL